MSDVDFTGLRDEAGQLARQPDFATVQSRAGRIRRARAGKAGAALGAVLLAGLLGVTALPRNEGAPSVPVGSPSSTRRVVWAGAGDPAHLYATVADCPTCPQQLLASTDGGQTWQKRYELPAEAGERTLAVLGPEQLVMVGPSEVRVTNPSAPLGGSVAVGVSRRTSPDGGRTWQEEKPFVVVGQPESVASPGCWDTRCTAVRVRLGPNAQATSIRWPERPPVSLDLAGAGPAASGVWAAGCHETTGGPATAVTTDEGRRWTVVVLPDETHTAGPAGCLRDADLATADGRTAYVVLPDSSDKPARVHRSTDGGATWQRTSDASSFAGGQPVPGSTYVTPDGSLVLAVRQGGTIRTVTSRDGCTFQPVELTGLPTLTDRFPYAAAPGTYLFHDGNRLHLSTDGIRWQQVKLP